MKTDRLWLEIQNLALAWGLDMVGAADLTSVKELVCRQGGEEISNYPRAISLGLGLSHAIIDNLPGRDPTMLASYDNLYVTVNATLDRLALPLAKHLEREGYRAFPVPASQSLPPERLHGLVSHKLAAHLAGLGWIGKNCLLVTPEFGPRVRLATILTDAPLPAKEIQAETHCGSCRACIDACPVNAFTNRTFDPADDVSLRFDRKSCLEYTGKYAAKSAHKHSSPSTVCGLCIQACPYGQKKRVSTGEQQSLFDYYN